MVTLDMVLWILNASNDHIRDATLAHGNIGQPISIISHAIYAIQAVVLQSTQSDSYCSTLLFNPSCHVL